jgi:uncharacterized membrane protein
VGTRLAFTSHPFTLVVVTVLALFELIADKLPRTPARTAPVGLIARVFFGGACGLALATSSRTNPLLNMAAAATGSVLAAFIGYNTRRIVGLRLHVQDFATAIAEDAVAITGAYLVLSHV